MLFSKHDIDEFVREDVPYIDLTTKILGIGDRAGKITFATREDTVLSGVEEVLRIFEKLDIKCNSFLPSGTFLEKDKVFIEAEEAQKQGNWALYGEKLKELQNILEKLKRHI